MISLLLLGMLTAFSATAGNYKPAPWEPGQPLRTIVPEEQPFWRTKERVYKKIVEGRRIVVSVQSSKMAASSDFKHHLMMVGAGHTATPLAFAYKIAKDFSHLQKMSSYVKSVSYDVVKHRLFLHTQAFNYHAKMLMRIEFRENLKDGQRKEIAYEIISGVFKGLTGVIRLDEFGPRATEVSLTAEYKYDKLPIPQFFISFGLEVVLQRMAGRMRAYTEDLYREEQAKPAKAASVESVSPSKPESVDKK